MNYIEKMSGAVDMDECPYRRTNTARLTVRIMCKCGPCAVCGYPKHTAIHNTVEFLDRNFRAAINEALELAAQEAENIGRLAVAGETGRGAGRFAAERIRRMKSPAGPVQPTDASPARESDHAGL